MPVKEKNYVWTIKFGTDGWRSRIAEGYTFDNLRRCAQGFATFLKEEGRAENGVVIGYDQRFQAEYFAAAAAEVLAGNGIHSLADRKQHADTDDLLCGGR